MHCCLVLYLPVLLAEVALLRGVVVRGGTTGETVLRDAGILALQLADLGLGVPHPAPQLVVQEAFEGPDRPAGTAPQADRFEEGNAGAGAQVEEVVLGVLHHGLALVPVVVHVEALAAGVGLAAAAALPADPPVPPAVQAVRLGADQLVPGGLLVLQPAEGAPPLLRQGGHRTAGLPALLRVQDDVLRLLHRAEQLLARALVVVRAGSGLQRPLPRAGDVVTGYEALARARVEGEAPAGEVFVESALLLTGDIVCDPTDDGVEVARVGVVSPLVGTVKLGAVDTGVLQVFL